MSARTLSAKRQVVLPAELCRRMALMPGSQVQISLSPDGACIVVRPATAARKPASVLFGRHVHRGTPVSVDELQGIVQAVRQARAGRR